MSIMSNPFSSMHHDDSDDDEGKKAPGNDDTSTDCGDDGGITCLDGERREKFVVVDARPELNARVNQAAGMGFENTPEYKQVCQVVFMDIANIHSMRKSLEMILDATATNEVSSASYLQQVEGSKWLFYLNKILDSSLFIARLVSHYGISVLIHCSDGWDRTAQLSSLSQLLMDPYYRTIKGFQVLIEKEWVAFGHKFSQRSGFDSHGYSSQERSPIFVQWLDAVHQVMRQFPTAFEFTEGLLLFLSVHIYSGWFGNFLFDSNKERDEQNITLRTLSIWSAVDCNKEQFINTGYLSTTKQTSTTLYPCASIKKLVVWESFFLNPQNQFLVVANKLGQGDTITDESDLFSRLSIPHNIRSLRHGQHMHGQGQRPPVAPNLVLNHQLGAEEDEFHL